MLCSNGNLVTNIYATAQTDSSVGDGKQKENIRYTHARTTKEDALSTSPECDEKDRCYH